MGHYYSIMDQSIEVNNQVIIKNANKMKLAKNEEMSPQL